jgi:hypothetical protein
MPRRMVEAAVAELGGIGSQGRVIVSVSVSVSVCNVIQVVVVVMGICGQEGVARHIRSTLRVVWHEVSTESLLQAETEKV